jgi:hypothetical protein
MTRKQKVFRTVPQRWGINVLPIGALIFHQSTMPAVQSSVKKPRPVYSGSRKFEAGYVAFMANVFNENVQSIESIETADVRMLVLAGAWRIRLEKRTGLLHCECLKRASNPLSEEWVPARFPLPSFWATDRELAGAIVDAWKVRLKWFVPSAEVCYPRPSKRNRHLHAEDRWYYALDQAASRRLGSRDVRRRVVRRFVAALWNFLVDRETLKICHAYFGRKASFEDYNFTVRRKRDLSERLAETPNLAPLIGSFIKSSTKLRTGRYRIPQDVLAQARAHLFMPPANEEALTPAGWRFLAGLTATALAQLWQVIGQRPQYWPDLIPMLNLVSKTGERPPLTYLKRLFSDVRDIRYRLSRDAYASAQESIVRFVRLAAQQAIAARKKGRLRRFVSGDLILATDWLIQRETRYDYHEGPRTPSAVPKNATWASIMRAQHLWHVQREERERIQREADAQAQREYFAQRDATTWSSSLPACEVMGSTVTPLVTGKDLREEGERMKHCVGGYVDYCVRNRSRIFAIKHLDEEATLELVESGSRKWRVRQVFGSSNTDVSKTIAAISRTVARMYETAERQARRA